jgi:hypothetical protein
MAETFDTDAEDSLDEQMVEQGRDNSKDGNNSNESYAPAHDDSLFLVREDDGSNNVGLDDILGTDLFSFDNDALGVDGTSDDDDAQSREAPADQLGADVEDEPTATCADEEEYPPTAEENVKFTDLDVASLRLLQLCDNSGTHRGLYNNILAFLHRLVKKKVDITKAKGRALFIATMQAKVKCPRPASKKVGGRDVYFPFIDSVRDLLRSNVFYDINNLCANRDEQNCFSHFKPTAALADLGEIMSNEWASDTQRRIKLEDDFDPDVDFFLPLQLYSNKTGTDIAAVPRLHVGAAQRGKDGIRSEAKNVGQPRRHMEEDEATHLAFSHFW